ncbi:hypothetical protein [Roseibium marinum]|uniref:Uncharacterized protein n=1 Tax=Roseibium marinum TaxID=281252 RepID=A0A2S3UN61_9HYPH|nr:hypothetical protein [Roseibium marinum]POF29152.1 hypothetical protein CLV41_110156 [Roseibium marinum]
MLDIYARSFQEATRFSASTRPDPVTQRRLEAVSGNGNGSLVGWLRRFVRLLALRD